MITQFVNLVMKSVKPWVGRVALILIVVLVVTFLLKSFYYFELIGSYCIRNPFKKDAPYPSELVCYVAGPTNLGPKLELSGSEASSSDDFVDENGNTMNPHKSLIVSGPYDIGEYFSEEQLAVISDFIDFREKLSDGKDGGGSWDWTKDFAYAGIENIDPVSKEVYIVFNFPTDQGFQEDGNKLITKISCLDSSTAVASRLNLVIREIGISIYDSIKPGEDELFFKCLNSDCSEIGGECIVVRDDIVE